MARDIDLRMQYNSDSVVVFEIDEDGSKYEVVRWTKDEKEETNNLVETVETTRELVEESPRGLIEKLYGSVEEWDKQKENRQLS